MKILIVEDHREVADQLARDLHAYGHEVDVCYDGIVGAASARTSSYSALVVDRMLPGLDGLRIVKGLREEGVRTPALFLTTMSGIDDRVEGLEAGGDDYLTKPFAFTELLARVNAIARRGEQDEPVRIRACGIEIDLIRRSVASNGSPVELQAQEFRLLEYLMRNAGRVVTRAMLLEKVWDLHFDPRTNIVETHISRLRSKLDHSGNRNVIHTLRGMGYRFGVD